MPHVEQPGRSPFQRVQDRPTAPRVGRRTFLAAAAVSLALAPVTGSASSLAAQRPWTIPALREWRPGAGHFELGTPTRILVRPGQWKSLAREARVFAADLRALTGRGARVVVAMRQPRRGEILLRLGAGDRQLGREGYRLKVGAAVVIAGNSGAGVLYGTRSLLQLLRQAPRPSYRLSAGVARDWPRYPERGLMLDNGRKHFSYDWIAARIKDLAYLKLNYLHLHFTDDQGWRIESAARPRVHSDVHITKEQVRRLVALGKRYHVKIIPEVDLPGHMQEALRNYPQFQLKDAAGQAAANKLDFTIPEARRWARGLVVEYLSVFPGDQWHVGGDEFLSREQLNQYPQIGAYAKAKYGPDATAMDAVIGFTNEIAQLVRRHGKRPRVWHDNVGAGSRVEVTRHAVVEWWTDFSTLAGSHQYRTPQQLLDAGYLVTNSSWYPTYYHGLNPELPPQPEPKDVYETWAVHRFHGPLHAGPAVGTPWHTVSPGSRGLLGSRLAQWNDDPARSTTAEIAAAIHPHLRVMAQKTWQSPPLFSAYADFQRVMRRVGRPPR